MGLAVKRKPHEQETHPALTLFLIAPPTTVQLQQGTGAPARSPHLQEALSALNVPIDHQNRQMKVRALVSALSDPERAMRP
jgi:hypothetical protein